MKDPSILVQAYAAAGVAAFNRNLLYRINTEPEGTDPEDHFAVILARRSPAGAHRGIASPYTVDASRRGVLS